MHETGGDLDAYRQRVLEEALQDPDFLAHVQSVQTAACRRRKRSRSRPATSSRCRRTVRATTASPGMRCVSRLLSSHERARAGCRPASQRTDRKRRFSTPGARAQTLSGTPPLSERAPTWPSPKSRLTTSSSSGARRIYREWRRANYFAPYMGESPSNIIQIYRDLADGGDILNVPLVGALRGPGVSTGR